MSGDNIFPTQDAMLYLVNAHRRLFLQKAFGLNPDGTPIPNIEDFNDEPIKTYRFVKTVAQYNELVRVLTYWGDDKFLASKEEGDPEVAEIRRFCKANKANGYNYDAHFKLLHTVCQEITVTKSNINNTMALTSEKETEIPDVDGTIDITFDKQINDGAVPRQIEQLFNVDTGCQEKYQAQGTKSESRTYVTLNLRDAWANGNLARPDYPLSHHSAKEFKQILPTLTCHDAMPGIITNRS